MAETVIQKLKRLSKEDRMNNPNYRKVDPDTLETVLTDAQSEYLDWLTDPNREGSKKAFAERVGVSYSTLYTWEKDRSFKEHMEKRLAEIGADPSAATRVLRAMIKAAEGGDVQAMKLFMEYTKRFTPTTKTVVEDASVKNLSDEELAAKTRQALRLIEGG